ncbi:dihydroceramide delta(4)-desaturase, partial [Emiliania huxleyi CCMP1516]
MGKGGSSTAAVEAPAVRGAKGKLVARTDFFWDDNDEPHAARRKAIMKAHPEVSRLTGPEWRSKYICLFALVLPQIWLSVVTADLPWLPYLAIAYVFGATITQALFLAIHELAHNLFFKSPLHNRLFSMVANWPIGIPYTIPFRGYHLEHHKFQGVDGVDTDVPSYFEAQHIRGPLSKTAWACCQILTYALRPMFIKAQDITAMHVTNWAVQIAFDAAMLYAFGWRPLAYMVLCILLAGGLHPCAGHFISEHYVF